MKMAQLRQGPNPYVKDEQTNDPVSLSFLAVRIAVSQPLYKRACAHSRRFLPSPPPRTRVPVPPGPSCSRVRRGPPTRGYLPRKRRRRRRPQTFSLKRGKNGASDGVPMHAGRASLGSQQREPISTASRRPGTLSQASPGPDSSRGIQGGRSRFTQDGGPMPWNRACMGWASAPSALANGQEQRCCVAPPLLGADVPATSEPKWIGVV